MLDLVWLTYMSSVSLCLWHIFVHTYLYMDSITFSTYSWIYCIFKNRIPVYTVWKTPLADISECPGWGKWLGKVAEDPGNELWMGQGPLGTDNTSQGWPVTARLWVMNREESPDQNPPLHQELCGVRVHTLWRKKTPRIFFWAGASPEAPRCTTITSLKG